MREQAGQLPLRQRVDAAITSTLLGTGYRQIDKTWMHLGGSDENPVSTALTLQPSQHDGTLSYVVLNFFTGPNPPQTPQEWVARRHASIRFEHMPRVLEALGKEEQPTALPRDLTVRENDPDATLGDAEQIAQTARELFDRIETPEDLLTLAEHMEKIKPNSSRLIRFTPSGRQALGISSA